MATQTTLVRSHIHRSPLLVLGLATILASVIIGGWLLRPTLPTSAPSVPVVSTSVMPARPATNRFFANEIAAARALDLTSAASGMQPEWEQVQIPHSAPVVVGLQPGISVANRFFANEIGGASMEYQNVALISGSLPERLQDLPRPTAAPAVVMSLPTLQIANRIFADEINAGAGTADETLPEVPATLPRHGPR